MSFIYSLALVEESWPANNLDTDASAPLNGSPTPKPSLWHDKTMAVSRLSRFGMTCKPLTDNHGAALLTLWLAVSRARTYPSPEKAQALTEPSQECGDTWRGSLARFDLDMSLWRTAQPSLLEDLGESSVTWPRSGMTAAGRCWELPMLGRRIKGTDSGLWQTPVADDSANRAAGKWNSRGEPKLSAQVLMRPWPTPTVCGNYNRKGASATSGDGLITALRTWPTPIRRDSRTVRGGARMKNSIRSEPLITQVAESERRTDGRLNPMWVEWLMGWPLGWTDLKPLATDKSQPAQPPLGES